MAHTHTHTLKHELELREPLMEWEWAVQRGIVGLSCTLALVQTLSHTHIHTHSYSDIQTHSKYAQLQIVLGESLQMTTVTETEKCESNRHKSHNKIIHTHNQSQIITTCYRINYSDVQPDNPLPSMQWLQKTTVLTIQTLLYAAKKNILCNLLIYL